MSRSAACLASALLAFAGSALAQSPSAQTPGAQTPASQSAAPGYGVSEPGSGRPAPSPEMVAARQAARQACAPDVAKFCADAQAGGGAVMQCVREHRSELSPTCSDALGALRAARRAAKG